MMKTRNYTTRLKLIYGCEAVSHSYNRLYCMLDDLSKDIDVVYDKNYISSICDIIYDRTGLRINRDFLEGKLRNIKMLIKPHVGSMEVDLCVSGMMLIVICARHKLTISDVSQMIQIRKCRLDEAWESGIYYFLKMAMNKYSLSDMGYTRLDDFLGLFGLNINMFKIYNYPSYFLNLRRLDSYIAEIEILLAKIYMSGYCATNDDCDNNESYHENVTVYNPNMTVMTSHTDDCNGWFVYSTYKTIMSMRDFNEVLEYIIDIVKTESLHLDTFLKVLFGACIMYVGHYFENYNRKSRFVDITDVYDAVTAVTKFWVKF